MSVLKPIFSKTFARHLGIIIVSGILLLIITFFSLKLYTRHGKGFEAPDFTGLNEQQFSHLIEKNELRYAIIDSVYIDNLPPGIVLEQTPKPGSLVKKNRNIFFTINSWTPEKVQMPDLIDYSVRNARVMLESFGLNVGKLIYVPSEYTNLILGQHYEGKPVEAGTPLERGSEIDLIVGQGLSNRTTAVPHLVGLHFEEAKEMSQDVSLNIGAQIFDSTVVSQEDTLDAFIWKQRPEASRNNQIRLGASIDIWLTTDSSHIEPDSASVDSLEKMINDENLYEPEEEMPQDEEFEDDEQFF